MEEKVGIVKEWYDGYHFGDADIYCPWDVIKYTKKLLADPQAEPETFWSVLFTTGYLTQRGRAVNGVYKLVIPNREVFVLQKLARAIVIYP